MSNLTIVTGIWNIGRNNAGEGFKRSFEHYLTNFNKLLISLKDSNVLIYIEEQYKNDITVSPNHRVYNRDIEWFKRFDCYDKVQEIRADEKWLTQASWLKNSAQASLEMYNPLVMSKYFLLNDAVVFNPFDTDYFVWIDGGITNTVHAGYFSHDKVLDKITKYLDPFLFVSFPYATGPEIHGFERQKMNELCDTQNVEYVCRGGIFGGHKNVIREHNSYYYNLLKSTLSTGYMGTEESIFTIMSYLKPDIFRRSMIEDNGLINKFFEDLKNDTIRLIPEQVTPPVKQVQDNKVSIYTLTFNSPDQFKKSCIAWSRQKQDFDRCRKILINNSTDKSKISAYTELCTEYNFEHIEMANNAGICGGRQFAAEHFDTSDSDFYIFLEDDMFLNPPNNQICTNGFRQHVPDLITNSLKIMLKGRYDFLKMCFTEVYGNNSTQWAWYNVPQSVRATYFPDYNRLPKQGLDPNAPRTEFNTIRSLEGIAYADGEIYYCNWPQMVSREGNKKMFLNTKWARPFEQTWMSHCFQLTKSGNLTSALLLATPITHDRFEYYESNLRKES